MGRELSAGDGLARIFFRVCNCGIRKAGPWELVFTSVLALSPGDPSGRVITKFVLKHFSAIRSVRFPGKTRSLTIQFRSFC